MTETVLASIIFPVKNEGENVKKTLESFFSAPIRQPYELIIVDDYSTDQCCDFLKADYLDKNISLITTDGVGAANARNEGAKLAKGQVLVFCDAHLEFEDYWLDLLIEPLLTGLTDAVTPAIGAIGNPHFTGYGQTLWVNERSSKIRTHWNVKQDNLFETAILPGGCFAINRSVFEDAGGFETGFPVWGYEDVEISIKLWLFGYKCHVQPKAKVLHLFRKVQPYRVELDEYFYNLLRLAYLHFSPARIYKTRKMLINGNEKEIVRKVLAQGALEKKQAYLARRRYDDDWFFAKFKIDF